MTRNYKVSFTASCCFELIPVGLKVTSGKNREDKTILPSWAGPILHCNWQWQGCYLEQV